MMINVHDHHEDESAEGIIMYNDTMKRKWKDEMKAHEIIKMLQHTQNTIKSIAFTHPASAGVAVVLKHTKKTRKCTSVPVI